MSTEPNQLGDRQVAKIYCCQCGGDVVAALIRGEAAYPHRTDLWELPFWQCPHCQNYVGCHHKTDEPTRPLGSIPNAAIRRVRKRIHDELDTLWKGGRYGHYGRNELYRLLAARLGLATYHTAEVNSEQDGEQVLAVLRELAPKEET